MTGLRAAWRERKPAVLGWGVALLAKAIGATLRIRVENEQPVQEPGGKVILTWHGRTFAPVYRYRHRGYKVIISNSRDGEMQKSILGRFGFAAIRGSTRRGGERALIESIRSLRAGAVLAVSPDGPRGPSGVVQPGVMAMARKSGAALIPGGVSASPRILMKSWDRYMVPLPFARVVFVIGDAVRVPADADDAEVERLRLALETQMRALEAEAERRLGREPLAEPRREEDA